MGEFQLLNRRFIGNACLRERRGGGGKGGKRQSKAKQSREIRVPILRCGIAVLPWGRRAEIESIEPALGCAGCSGSPQGDIGQEGRLKKTKTKELLELPRMFMGVGQCGMECGILTVSQEEGVFFSRAFRRGNGGREGFKAHSRSRNGFSSMPSGG